MKRPLLWVAILNLIWMFIVYQAAMYGYAQVEDQLLQTVEQIVHILEEARR